MDIHALNPENRADSALLGHLVDNEGTGAHPYCTPAIARRPDAFVRRAGDFADAVHHLSLLHGNMPGVIDHAATRIADNAAREWLLKTLAGFGRERTYLNQLVVAVGPLPSTMGQQNMTGIITQQRRALEMLAQSDRRGTALGAAMALILDWEAIRSVLDAGAGPLGVDAPAINVPARSETLELLAALESAQPIARAVQFGATQLLGQHRGIWDLLQARAEVRREQNV